MPSKWGVEGRTKDLFRDEVTAPAVAYGISPLCSNDTRSGERSAVYLPFPAVSIFVLLPDFCRGVFAFICSLEFSAVNLLNTSKIMLADNRIYFVKFALNE